MFHINSFFIMCEFKYFHRQLNIFDNYYLIYKYFLYLCIVHAYAFGLMGGTTTY